MRGRLISVCEPSEAPSLEALAVSGHSIHAAASVDEAIEAFRSGGWDAILWAPPLDAAPEERRARTEALRIALGAGVLIVLVADPDEESAIDLIRAGADAVLGLGCRFETLLAYIERALERSRTAARARAEAAERERGARALASIIGNHPSMQRLGRKIEQAAKSKATVLVTGETGTGKELVARAIHEGSARAGLPFVRLNCAALAESVLESELFGHERGAFTGAIGRRKGRLEQANGGTLFLDEASEMPRPVQVKLLRFLQERELERVGGNETLKVDVRVVAASNRDLKAMVDDGTFREDLYYRLNVVRLEVAPLRARPSDIPALAEHFLSVFAEREGKPMGGFTDEALRALVQYPWPGNVRELENAIEQAVVLSEGPRVTPDDLPFGAETDALEPVRLMVPGVTLAELERWAIMRTLESVGGSPTHAAKVLGVSRRTIQYRLQEWGISRAKGESLGPEAGAED